MIVIKILFFRFILFSLLGYIVECIYTSIIDKKINIKRGFFYGPYCPIYGITILILDIFSKLNIFYLSIISIIIISLIEYFTSFILEKIFNKKWWDYSNQKYNLHGRICLKNLILFTIGGVYVVKKIIPIIKFYLNDINYILIFLLFIIFIIDMSFSIKKYT